MTFLLIVKTINGSGWWCCPDSDCESAMTPRALLLSVLVACAAAAPAPWRSSTLLPSSPAASSAPRTPKRLPRAPPLTEACHAGARLDLSDLLSGEVPDEGAVTSYVAGVLPRRPGVLFAIINCVSGVCCCCCRGPCAVVCHRQKYCRVCHCIPATRHYTNEEVCMPVVVWIVFSLLLFSFAVAGVVNGTHKFSDSMVRGVCLVDETYLKFNQFLDNVEIPLVTLKTDFSRAADDLTQATQVNQSLAQNVKDLEFRFDDLWSAANDAKDAAVMQSCKDAWEGIATAASSASAAARRQERNSPNAKRLANISDSSVVQQKGSAEDAINSASIQSAH